MPPTRGAPGRGGLASGVEVREPPPGALSELVEHVLAEGLACLAGNEDGVGSVIESHWPWWRLGLLDFDQWLVGPFRSVERLLELCWLDVAEVAV